MFVLNPDPFLSPAFRISPFRTSDIAANNQLPKDNFLDGYCDRRFGSDNWEYTVNGREAIKLALETYGLKKDDLVTILTTSENFYISSCVTSQISNFCRWNRELQPETKLIFVNHEFGNPHPGMEKIIATGLPIIEDCCTTFFSLAEHDRTGKFGDFAIYSFPKFFPLQIGGLLVSNKNKALGKSSVSADEIRYIENVVSKDLRNEAALLHLRKERYQYGLSLFTELGFSERFESSAEKVPALMLLNNHGIVKDLNALKVFLNQHGIQNSVFYGEDAFFIPSHQNLEISDYDYFLACVKEFLNSQ